MYKDQANDGPVKFTSSPAYKMTPAFRGRRQDDDTPWIQSYVVGLSTAAILVYFCILREENDIDDLLRDGSLYDRIEGLEKLQLESSLKYYEESGLDTRPIKKRLAEIEQEEKRAAENAKS